MKRKYNYFYRTENLLNGKFYYGIHKTDDLEDGYLGSGVRLRVDIDKYGIENFDNEILKKFNSYEEALKYEAGIVNEVLLEDVSCYNIAKGGNSGEVCYGYGPPLYHKETGKFIKAKNKAEYDLLWNSSKYEGHTKGRAIYKDKYGKKYSLYKGDPIIMKLNLRSIFKERIYCKDDKGRAYLVEKNDLRYISGKLKKTKSFFQKHSEESKRKISESNKKRGLGLNNSQYGTCWVYNKELKKNKKIKKSELAKWEKNGWEQGLKMVYHKNKK